MNKKILKNSLITLLSVFLSLTLFTRCGGSSKNKNKEKTPKKQTQTDSTASTNTTGNTNTDSTSAGSNSNADITLNQDAINLTKQQLQQDPTVKDFVVKVEDNRIYVTIQVDASTNKDKAKSLIDSAVRQLASHAGGKIPTKDYYGQLWDKNSGIITVFAGVKAEILTGTKSPGENSPIIYH